MLSDFGQSLTAPDIHIFSRLSYHDITRKTGELKMEISVIHHELLNQLKSQLPPVFPATKLTELTGGVICWRSIQNLRSIDKKKGCKSRFPLGTFTYSGSKIIINRDKLLDWWSGTLRS
jgi:hypothetical protein